jgi:hypothetical protein
VDSLTVDERGKFAETFLSQHGKKLNIHQLNLIVKAPQCSNPRYLRTLLEEVNEKQFIFDTSQLRIFGSYENLENNIKEYLEATDVESLYERIISRWELDFSEVNTLQKNHLISLGNF